MPRNQRWAGWLSRRRCQIIDSVMRGDGNGSSFTIKGHTSDRPLAERRGKIEPPGAAANRGRCGIEPLSLFLSRG